MRWSSGLGVTADGTGVVAHPGSVATRLLADRVGVASELSKALTKRLYAKRRGR